MKLLTRVIATIVFVTCADKSVAKEFSLICQYSDGRQPNGRAQRGGAVWNLDISEKRVLRDGNNETAGPSGFVEINPESIEWGQNVGSRGFGWMARINRWTGEYVFETTGPTGREIGTQTSGSCAMADDRPRFWRRHR